MIAGALARVVAGGTLSRSEMGDVFRALVAGDAPPAVVGGLLAALAFRGETLDEIVGAAASMRALAVPLPEAPPDAIDTCGTGGDRAGTWNLSTVGALIAAGAGARVAKHGNRAATSRCGSAELLEALGVRIELPPAQMARSLERIGITFLYARACHPALAQVAPVRSALGIPTLFNRLGPLANPMHVRRQLVGVAKAELVEPQLAALRELGAECAWVVFGTDGLDELSPCAPTEIAILEGGRERRLRIEPGSIVPEVPRSALAGGLAGENAAIARGILEGEAGPRRSAALLQAAAALCVAGRVGDLREGVAAAEYALDRGAALDLLKRWVALTSEAGA